MFEIDLWQGEVFGYDLRPLLNYFNSALLFVLFCWCKWTDNCKLTWFYCCATVMSSHCLTLSSDHCVVVSPHYLIRCFISAGNTSPANLVWVSVFRPQTLPPGHFSWLNLKVLISRLAQKIGLEIRTFKTVSVLKVLISRLIFHFLTVRHLQFLSIFDRK